MTGMPQTQHASKISEEQELRLQSSSSSILNETLIAQYVAMDEGVIDDPLLPKLFGMFRRHFPEHMHRLSIALHTQDESEVNYVIHKMLGMAHNVGALRLSDMLMILENAEIASKMRLTEDDLALLQAEFEAAEAAFLEFMNDSTN